MYVSTLAIPSSTTSPCPGHTSTAFRCPSCTQLVVCTHAPITSCMRCRDCMYDARSSITVVPLPNTLSPLNMTMLLLLWCRGCGDGAAGGSGDGGALAWWCMDVVFNTKQQWSLQCPGVCTACSVIPVVPRGMIWLSCSGV